MLKVMTIIRATMYQTPKATLALQIVHRLNDVRNFAGGGAGDRVGAGGGEHGGEDVHDEDDHVCAVVVPICPYQTTIPLFPGRLVSTSVSHQHSSTLHR